MLFKYSGKDVNIYFNMKITYYVNIKLYSTLHSQKFSTNFVCDFILLSLFTHTLYTLKISYFMFWLLLSSVFHTSLEGKT